MRSDNKRALIYGAGNNCIFSMYELCKRFEIIGIADGDASKQGKSLFGLQIGKISDFDKDSFDIVIITPSYSASIRDALIEEGIDGKKLIPLEDALADSEDGSNLSIAIIFYGGLGDYIIGKNWLYHLNEYADLSDAEIHAYFSGNTMENAGAVFFDSELITKILPINTDRPELIQKSAYSLVMRFSVFPMVQYLDGHSLSIFNKKLFSYAADLWKFGSENYNTGFFSSPDFYHTVSSLFRMFPDKKYHAIYDVLNNLKSPEEYHCKYSIAIDEDAYLSELGLETGNYITVNTGANEEYSRKPSTRTWGHDNWVKLISILKARLKNGIKIVRMGLSSSGGDETKADLDLTGETNVEQAKVILKNAAVHVDYEGGLVHLRYVLNGGPSVVLHGPTSVERYGYAENTPIRSMECINACEWSERDWLTVCHNEEKPFGCMRSITPEMVSEQVIAVLSRGIAR